MSLVPYPNRPPEGPAPDRFSRAVNIGRLVVFAAAAVLILAAWREMNRRANR